MLTSLAARFLPSAAIIDLIRNVTNWAKMAAPIIMILFGNILVVVAAWRAFQYAFMGHRKGGEHLGNFLIAAIIGGCLIIGGGFILHLMVSTGNTINQWGGGMIMPAF